VPTYLSVKPIFFSFRLRKSGRGLAACSGATGIVAARSS
jgi:hypothetical protein